MITARIVLSVVTLIVATRLAVTTARSATEHSSYTWRTVTAGTPPPLFYSASSVAAGPKGNLFVADSGDHRIEKFSPGGSLLSSWGSDTPGPTYLEGPRAVAVDTDGTVYLADRGVTKLSYAGRVLGHWNRGALSRAQGLAVGTAHHLYVLSVHPVPHSVSFDRLTISTLSPGGKLLKTFVYSYSSQFGGLAAALATTPDGNLVLSLKLQRPCHDCNGTYFLLRIISPSGRILSDLPVDAGGDSVSVSAATGDIYLTAPHTIERFSASGVRTSTFGSAGCGAAELGDDLRVVVSPPGLIYVVDSQIAAHRPDNYPSPRRVGVLHRFASDGTDAVLYGTCPLPGARTLFGQINDLALGTAGRLFVADGITSSIDRIGPGGQIAAVLAADHPSTVATDRNGNYYISSFGGRSIEQHAPNGRLLAQTRVLLVEKVAISPRGEVYALTAFGDVLVLPPVGHGNVPLRRWRMVGYAHASGGLNPTGICLDGAGNVWVSDTRHNNIQKYAPSGRLLLQWGRGGSGPGRFQNPSGLTVDGRGHLFVLDSGNNRIQEYDLQGRFLATFGREGEAWGQLRAPYGIGADRHGSIYVGERGNDRIQALVLRVGKVAGGGT